MPYLLLILGLGLIIVASDILIEVAKIIAIKLRVPKLLIALTVVAFGTCAPELAISFQSVANNNGSIALANVMGSCIVNILLIIGLAIVFQPLKIKNTAIKKELPLLVLITSVFTLLMANGILNPAKKQLLSQVDGLILIGLFTLFCVYVIQLAKKKEPVKKEKKPDNIWRAFIYLGLTIWAIAFSADLLVNNAVIIADQLGISQKIITMVVIVIGTSLPELFLTVAAARKKEPEMAIGNIVGTNIFNICVVLGLPMVVFGGLPIIDFNLFDLGVVFLAALMLFIFAKSEKKLSRSEGSLMLLVFVLYYVFIIFKA